MRLLLKEGKQKELLNLEKDKLGWKELSKKLGIKYGKLMAYVNEESLISEKLFNTLSKNREYNQFIIEKRKENWGQINGGKISKGKTKKISIPKDSEELAEFYGIMLGDGNSTKIKDYKIGTYMIRIVGDLNKDKEYLSDYVKQLIEELFKIKVRVGRFKSNAMFIEAHSIKLVDFLESKGFKPGNKIKNQLQIPKWIKQNPKYLSLCLRGLYDTDGSVYKLTNQNCYQIDFCNKNQYLLEDVRESLICLGICPSKISKRKDIYITKKEEIRKFLKLIGFRNPKHLCRLEMFNLMNR